LLQGQSRITNLASFEIPTSPKSIKFVSKLTDNYAKLATTHGRSKNSCRLHYQVPPSSTTALAVCCGGGGGGAAAAPQSGSNPPAAVKMKSIS